MRLSRLFLLTTTLLLSLVTLMLARSVMADRQTLHAAEAGLVAMQRAYLAMKVAEKASAERGPTIPVLNDREPPDPARRQRLQEFRATTDRAFAEALAALDGAADAPSLRAQAELTRGREELGRARIEVDRVAALPLSERSAPGRRLTRAPIDQMFAVIDTVLGGVTTLSASAEAVYPELAMPLVGARYAAELREYAGRLGSQFTAPLASQAPLGPEERREIPQLVGRIEQLRKLITVQASVSGASPATHSAIDAMQARYFGEDLPFIHALTELGQPAGPAFSGYGMDSAAFVARYVPPMKSIVELRDSLFAGAREAATQRVQATEARMWTNAGLGLAILCIEVGVFLLIRHRVLVPVLRNTRAMVGIMQGRVEPSDNVPPGLRRDEIGDMERAVAALRDATLRGRALEAEREQLIERLREAGDTDFLTGLPNRRAFSERAAALLIQARRHDWPLALVVFDLDHFKLVNDQHGHPVGDRALRHVAELCRQQVRGDELLARHGGEEFVILAPDCSPEAAAQLAERLRLALQDAALPSDGGQTLRLSASFGVACALARSLGELDGLFREADRALYAAKAAGRNRVQLAPEMA